MSHQLTLALLRELKALKIKLSVSGTQLAVDAPKGSLTPELIQGIKQHKAQLIQWLQASTDERSSLPLKANADFRGLSFSESRFWWLQKLSPKSNQYHIHLGLSIEGPLNVSTLRRVHQALLHEHEALRTQYKETQGEVHAHVRDLATIDIEQLLPVFDLRVSEGNNLNEQTQRIRAELTALCQVAFSLDTELPIRGLLLRLDDVRYQLHWCVHHIAVDAWSIQQLVTSFTQYYQHYSQDDKQPLNLTPVSYRYRDYAYAQQQADQKGLWQEQWNYWQQQLNQLPAQHGLILDYPRNAANTSAKLQCEISDRTVRHLKRLCRQQSITLFMLLQGLLAVVFARFGQLSDVVMGSPVAGRQHAAFSNVVGCFVNTLVLRHQVNFDDSVHDYLQQVCRTVQAAISQQDLPFERLVEFINPPRQAHVNPLFQLCFALNTIETESSKTQQLGPCTLRALPSQALAAKFDVDIAAVETQTGLRIGWEYNANLFQIGSMQQALNHWVELLNHVAADDFDAWQVCVGELSSKPDEAVCHESLETNVPKQSALAGFLSHAKHQPQALAVQHEWNGELQGWNYVELAEQSEQLARYLIAKFKLSPGDRVALCLPRSGFQLLTILAVWRCGAAYVPLDHQQPKRRLQNIIDDLHARLMIVDDVFAEEGQNAIEGIALLNLHAYRRAAKDEALNEDAVLLPPNPALKDCAYIIYTSGSTGTPKGVMVSHGNVAYFQQCFEGLIAPARCASPRVTAWSSNYTFDASVEGIVALCSGHPLVVIPDAIKTDLPALRSYIQTHRIELMDFTPSQLEALWVQQKDQQPLLPLPALIVAGEAVNQALWQRLARYASEHHCYILQAYGPTETTVFATTISVESKPGEVAQQAQLGHALPGTTLRVIDEQGRTLPPGAIGELEISGPGVSLGYWQRETLNQQRFRAVNPLPYQRHSHYLSGDLVRYGADGRLQYLGRKDQQLKWRGYRIEAGEIEAALATHPKVRRALVFLQGEGAQAILLAYYEADTALPKSLLDEQLSNHIPSYMQPSHYVQLKQWPLNSSGKVDRNALPAINTTADVNQHAEPQTEVDSTQSCDLTQQLCHLFAEFLPSEYVQADDDFFALGGHSLLVVHLLAKLQTQLNVEIRLADFFQHSKPQQLARFIEGQQHTANTKTLPTEPLQTINHYPMTSAQRRYWLLNQNSKTMAQYHVPLRVRLTAVKSLDAIHAAVHMLLEQHDVLRTIYPQDENSYGDWPQAQVLHQYDLPNKTIDLSILEEKEQQNTCQQIYLETLQKPFDLTSELPFRYVLVALGQQRYECVWVFHHIAIDDWSLRLLMQQWLSLYEQWKETDDIDTYQRQNQHESSQAYAHYALWEHEQREKGAWFEQGRYWQHQLKNVEGIHHLPLDASRHHEHPNDVAQALYTQALNQDDLAKLQRRAQHDKVSLYVLLQTMLAATLKTFCDRFENNAQDLLIGTVVSRREQSRWCETVACLNNTLVMRHDWSLSSTFVEAVQKVHYLHTQALSHQDYPIEQLIDDLGVLRLANAHPLFQILLDYQHDDDEQTVYDFVEIDSTQSTLSQAKQFDLHISIRVKATGIQLHWRYHASLFNSSTIQQIANAFAHLLHGQIEASHVYKNDSLLQQFERFALQQLRQSTVATKPFHKQNKTTLNSKPTVWQGLSRQAAMGMSSKSTTNTQWAVLDSEQDKALSWRELSELSDNWACYLAVHFNVRVGDVVGLQLNRGVDQILLIIALWKCGAAYVPLAMDTPAQRRLHMLTECDVRLLIHEEPLQDLESLAGANINICSSQTLRLKAARWLCQQKTNPKPRIDALAHNAKLIAYVLYTSGSTGRPKGVAVRHGELQHFQQAFIEQLEQEGVDDQRRFAWNAAYTFDVSLEGLLWLCAGRRLAITPDTARHDPVALAQWVEQYDIDLMDFTPSHLAVVMGDKQHLPVPNIVLAGEAVAEDQWQKLRALNEDTDSQQWVLAAYGPTEATVLVSAARIETEAKSVHMGMPLAGTEGLVMGPEGYLQVQGAVGELWLAGPQLSTGYVKQAQLTATAFVPHPYPNESQDRAQNHCIDQMGQRCYRSGDLVRCLDDGKLQFIRRIDDQVKLHGYRIELGEIAASLRRAPGIRDAVAIKDQDRLLAYVVFEHPSHFNGADEQVIKQKLAEQLPSYMLPHAIIALDCLPLNHSGKLDKTALPRPELVAEPTLTPLSPLEQTLSDIWRRALKREAIDTHADFYALGGDSLRSIAVLQYAQQAGISLDLNTLLKHRSIAAIASFIESNKAKALNHKTPTALNNDTNDYEYAPLNRMQRWMAERYRDDTQRCGVFHVQHAYRIQADERQFGILQQRLAQALKAGISINAQEVIGSAVVGIEKQAAHEHSITVSFDDGRDATVEPQQYVNAWLTTDRQQAFQTEKGLCRVHWHRLSATQYLLLMSHHHALWDGWSLSLIREQLKHVVVQANDQKDKVDHCQHAIDFYRHEQRISLDKQQINYWQRQQKPHRRAIEQCQRVVGMQREYADAEINTDLALAIAQQCQRLGVSRKALLLWAWQQALLDLEPYRDAYRYIGTVSHRRHEAMNSPLSAQGMYWNLVPIHMPECCSDSTHSLLQLQKGLDEVAEYSHYPYPSLIELNQYQEWFVATFNYIQFDVPSLIGDTNTTAKKMATSIKTLAAMDDFGYSRQCTIQAESDDGVGQLQVRCLIYRKGNTSPSAQEYLDRMQARLGEWNQEPMVITAEPSQKGLAS
jgi:amino acid adenylation domain-containing protein